MGYLVVVATLLLLIFFVARRISDLRMFDEPLVYEGYYLLVRKYEAASCYYGVFQQGEQELILELSPTAYVQLHAPVRGYLKASAGKVLAFE